MVKKFVGIAMAALLLCSFCLTSAYAAVHRSQVLMRGDQDEWVEELQQALYDQGYLKQSPTGYFGSATQAAVIAFQKDAGITVDGKAGPVTRKNLLGDGYREITTEGRDDRAEEDQLEGETLRQGDRGDDVESVQKTLKKLEYYDYDKITGYFGTVTKDAVEKFQRTHGLVVDGTVNDETREKLFSDSAKYYTMYPGDRGDDIADLQKRLKELGYFNSSATGYFGSITKAAVKAFQKDNDLAVDGLVGKNTRAVLFAEDAKKASGSPSSSDEDSKPKSKVETFISVAEGCMGKKYVYGAEGPNTFDCSGLVYYALKNSGVKVSRLSSRSYSSVSSWKDVKKKDDLKRGDLIFFCSDSSKTVSHVAIYLGNNEILHAVPSSGKVCTTTLSGYWSRNYVSAKRIFE